VRELSAAVVCLKRRVVGAMARIALPVALVGATLAVALPAQAVTLTRTYVSQAGSDSNPCTSTQPCRHFTNAYANTAPNGIITALDPGGYGPITITTAVTINGLGWASITAPSAGDGIDINAGATDQITLLGLTVDGAGAGYNGVVLNSGGSLTITSCVVQNFAYDGTHLSTGNGILIQPMSGTVNFLITNTTATNNGNAGITYDPRPGSVSVNGIVDHAAATNNGYGFIAQQSTSGSAATIVIADSIASTNFRSGIFASSAGTLILSVDNATISDNQIRGIEASGGSQVVLGRSVVTGNGTGITNGTPGTFYTYGDNRINLNGTDFSGTALTPFGPQ
jgi:hypothetical protein